jgi:hypothetical protein
MPNSPTPLLDPYLRYISLKDQRNQASKDINIPSVQLHSYFGLLGIPGYDKIFLETQANMREKYKAHWPKPETIPTAADGHVDQLKTSRKLLSQIALLCVMPSSPSQIAERVSYHVDEVKPILASLKNRQVLKENSQGYYVLSLVADNPPTGSPLFEQSVIDAALKGWVETKARKEDIDNTPYATIVEDIKTAHKKSVKNILVLDLLRAPKAYPDEKQVQPGQLGFLFEDVYSSPLEEACLFATLSMPQTSNSLRDEFSSALVSNMLRKVWGQAQDFGFIDSELKTTPYGERVIATLTGTPLAPFRHMKTLDQYCSRSASFEIDENYGTEFTKVIYSGVLYDVLSESCGLEKATQIVQYKPHVDYFLSIVRTPDFYLPNKLANELKVDETSAKSVLAQAFRYGACGISTASHPHLYTRKKKVGD